jgi:sugar (pentulose or hexulose) kinase
MDERFAAIRQDGSFRERSAVMAEGPYLLGIDFGTGGARVGIFDPEGTPLVFSERGYTLKHPRPGWAGQDPDEWWSCLVAAVKGAIEESSISPEDIAGISVDAMSSTVLAMDENDRHLRPAIMWMDVRSSEQADRARTWREAPSSRPSPSTSAPADSRRGCNCFGMYGPDCGRRLECS